LLFGHLTPDEGIKLHDFYSYLEDDKKLIAIECALERDFLYRRMSRDILKCLDDKKN
jgi:hypothetical protein